MRTLQLASSCSALSRTKFGMWQKVSFLNKRHAGFALWSMVVLGRMPEAAHGRLPVRELKQKEIQLERAVYATAAGTVLSCVKR